MILWRYPLIAVALFIAGAAGLVLEVTWQRAIAGLTGGEARSMSLVLGVFLAGLALGYRHWGGVAGRLGRRRALVRAAGLVELALGAWALLSPWWLVFLGRATSSLVDSFLLDALLTAAVVGPPAFLMGGSLPLLSKGLPRDAAQVGRWNARAYGVNTLGASAGAWVAGFWLVPALGVSSSARLAGLAELLAGVGLLVTSGFIRGAPATRAAGEGLSRSPNAHPRPVPPGPLALLFPALASGAAAIALEVVVTRMGAMAVGPSVFVFPLILGLFVLGLGLGAVSLGRGSGGVRVDAAVGCALLVATYLAVPYWPNWALLVRQRVHAGNIPYWGYWVEMGLLFGAFVVPAAFFVGRILPSAFAAAAGASDPGRACGRIYSINALGTVLGACGLGYLALGWLDLEGVFRVSLALVAAAGLCQPAWRSQQVVAALTAASLALAAVLPRWDRASYHLGLFREKTAAAARADGRWLAKPALVAPDGVEFERDGPDATVTVARFERTESSPATRSLVINGKSDANTVGDYPTMALIGVLPYLLTEKEGHLRAAVVGVASGVTAGVLARLRDVERIDAIEISPTVVEALPYFGADNGDLVNNPKINLVRADALRFLRRGQGRRYDLIVSEPSNPWVAGNEALYTTEFYRAARARLAPGGCLAQWFHLYEMNEQTLSGILANLAGAFLHADAYVLGNGDVGVFASDRALAGVPGLAPQAARRFREPGALAAVMRSGVLSLDELALLHLFDERYMRWYAALSPQPRHDLDHPWLAARAAEALFDGRAVTAQELIMPDADRASLARAGKARAFARLLEAHPRSLPQCLERRFSGLPLCQRYEVLTSAVSALGEPNYDWGWHRLLAYQSLLQAGFVEPDPALLGELRDRIIAETGPLSRAGGDDLEMRKQMAVQLVREYRREGLAELSALAERRFRAASLF